MKLFYLKRYMPDKQQFICIDIKKPLNSNQDHRLSLESSTFCIPK